MSRYEKMFGVKRRGRGRPVGRTSEDVVFSFSDKEYPELAKMAKQRTYAIITERNRPAMKRIFEDEYRHLVAEERRKAEAEEEKA